MPLKLLKSLRTRMGKYGRDAASFIATATNYGFTAGKISVTEMQCNQTGGNTAAT